MLCSVDLGPMNMKTRRLRRHSHATKICKYRISQREYQQRWPENLFFEGKKKRKNLYEHSLYSARSNTNNSAKSHRWPYILARDSLHYMEKWKDTRNTYIHHPEGWKHMTKIEYIQRRTRSPLKFYKEAELLRCTRSVNNSLTFKVYRRTFLKYNVDACVILETDGIDWN